MRSRLLALGCAVLVSGAFAACGGTTGPSGFDNGGDAGGGDDGGGTTDDGGGTNGDDSGFVSFDGGDAGVVVDSGPPPEVAVVYAHSPSQLYKVDPKTKGVTLVGSFSGGCSSVIDLAIDANSNAFVTTFSAFYKLDLATAKCTQVSTGSYPNSLSFVPKGTLDANAEALVGYFGSTYVRIDTSSGAVTNVGTLTGGYSSSGDIVSVINGGTFLTVNGNSCNDCLLQVDPKTGNVVQNYGSVNHSAVYGLAFWGGTLFGFDAAGELFQITAKNNAIVTQNINIPNAPPNLVFWGAGSTTSAPVTDQDGGGIPIK